MLILFYLVEYDEEIISIANNIKNINLDDKYISGILKRIVILNCVSL
jgi:hypothetical protein